VQTYSVDTRPTVLLIDGAHALRRSMYAQNLRELSNSQGMPTGAIYGFLNILKAAVTSMSANALIVCWEGGHSERRLQVYDQYKHREYEEEPEKDVNGYTDYEYYCHQLSWVQKILECLGVHQLRVEGKEGDDVLYQAAHLLSGRKIIISEDRDFYALVSDDVSLYRPIKKEYIDMNNFKDVSGYLSPTHYLYGKVLLGDGSDNIPSVAKGVGEKTVLSILDRIESPEEVTPSRILKEAASIGNSRCMKLVSAGESTIVRNLDLIDISREPFDVFQLQSLVDELNKQKYPNHAIVRKLFRALEFNEDNAKSMRTRLSAMSEYPLHQIINKDYIKQVMMGGI
jgi:5'-3' exonuclease